MNRMRAEKRGLTYPPTPKANGVLESGGKKNQIARGQRMYEERIKKENKLPEVYSFQKVSYEGKGRQRLRRKLSSCNVCMQRQ